MSFAFVWADYVLEELRIYDKNYLLFRYLGFCYWICFVLYPHTNCLLVVKHAMLLIVAPYYGFTQRSHNLEWIDTHALLVRVVTMICSSHLNVMQKAGWWGLLGGWPLLFRAVFLCLPNLAYWIGYMLPYRFYNFPSLIQFFALYDSNKDFTYNYYFGFSWIVRFGDPVDQWSERFWPF